MDNLREISVVIPAYNEENWIQLPLKGLKEQDYEGEYEIIVVDNASEDDTAEIAEDYGVEVVSEPEKGATRALQTGFESADNPIIAVTDADTKIPSNWLAEINKSFSEPDVIGAYGPAWFHDAEGFYHWLAKLGFPAFLKVNYWLGKPHFSGFNMAVEREAFMEVGGFDLSVQDANEVELSQRLKEHGKIVYNEDMIVETSSRRLQEEGIQFFIDSAINYFNIVWLQRAEKTVDEHGKDFR
ncbi:glycosyltransferase family 2 protein [Candidatus Bipolaricaulota bacterium]|nr:glycosyltransferase family 2 protein [Candidatus Bipolaricaulota bacterium]